MLAMSWYNELMELVEEIFALDLKNKTDGLDAAERARYKALNLKKMRLWAYATDGDFREAMELKEKGNPMAEHWTLEHLQRTRLLYLQRLPPASPREQ